jgi:hypothetical protein
MNTCEPSNRKPTMNITIKMNPEEFRQYCQEFFDTGSFESPETLEQEIGGLPPTKFAAWRDNMICEYHKKYDFVRDIIAQIREAEGFSTKLRPDMDWSKDPLKKIENLSIVQSYMQAHDDIFAENVKRFPIYNKKETELNNYIVGESNRQKLAVIVDNKSFMAETVIDVLWAGWECDDRAWLVNDDGVLRVVATNHGEPYFVEPEFLKNKISEYKTALQKTEAMLERLENQK